MSAVGGRGAAVTALSVVVPCFNEAENVVPCYREIVEELGRGDLDLELVFVDDGSTDATLARIKELADADPRVQFLSFTRNFGFEAAFSAGYRYASRPWILHLDADQQFPPAEGRTLIAAAEEGDHDAVFGVRQGRRDPLRRRLGTAGFQLVARRLLRIELPPGATAFRLVRSDLARAIVDLRLGTPYFLATVPRLTDRYAVVPVSHRPRARGRSTIRFRFLARHAIELFAAFTTRPSTLASTAALLAGSVATVLAVVAGAGSLGAREALTAALALLAVVLVVLALVVRQLVLVQAGHARPRLYYVREASLPVEADDLLCTPSGVPAGASPARAAR